jgi:hypothetical protein
MVGAGLLGLVLAGATEAQGRSGRVAISSIAKCYEPSGARPAALSFVARLKIKNRPSPPARRFGRASSARPAPNLALARAARPRQPVPRRAVAADPGRSPRTVPATSSGSDTPEAGAATPEGMTCPGVRKARLLN